MILFVPDGMRASKVSPTLTPTMAAVRDQGVNFKNSHSLMPTFTTANASAMATGHYLGDTSDFSNTLYVGFPVKALNDSVTPFVENDRGASPKSTITSTTIISTRKRYFGSRARRAMAPPRSANSARRWIFDHTSRTGTHTIIFDDSTGKPERHCRCPTT